MKLMRKRGHGSRYNILLQYSCSEILGNLQSHETIATSYTYQYAHSLYRFVIQ